MKALIRILTVLVFLTGIADSVQAQNAVADAGLYVAVTSPISSDNFTRIKNRVTAARERADRRPATIIFDFNPTDKDSQTPEFGPAYDLAEFIAGLQDVTTVGYIHRKVTGHSVLPVFGCKQIVLGPQGQLGDVISANDPPLSGYKANSYSDLMNRSRGAYAAVVKKMYDPNVQLRRGKKGGSDWFVDLRDQPNFVRDKIEVTDLAQLKEAPDGKVRLFTADNLRDLGVSRRTVASRAELFDAFGVTSVAMKDDPLAGRVPSGFRHVIAGKVDGSLREAVGRIVRDTVRQKGNVLILQLECSGGDLQAARDLADDLRKAQESEEGLLIVAFIPDRAPDTAAVIALGCSEIVMSKRKDASTAGDGPTEAEFGDFETAAGKVIASNPEFWITSLKDLADAGGYPPILIEGMLRKDLEIFRVHRKDNRSIRRLVSGDEYRDDKSKGMNAEWVQESQIKAKGQFLKLTATRAEELGLARFTVESRDPADVYSKYGLDTSKVRDAKPGVLDIFAEFLKIPAVTVLLVVIGFTGLILELKVPGTAVPGIVAALCFIMVFWAHTQFSGQVAVLAGLLFLLGLILIMLEVFVFPGFGAPGVIGILLMLGSLTLITIERGPNGDIGYWTVGVKLAQYVLGMIGAVVLAFILARFLPNIPYANRMMLIPPGETGEADEVIMPGAATAARLLGAVGTSVTVLRPAGSVMFGEEYIDVVSEGGFIPAGARVQVVEVEGNRIVVKEV